MRSGDYETLNTVVILPLMAGQQASITPFQLSDLEGANNQNGMFSYFSAHLLYAQ